MPIGNQKGNPNKSPFIPGGNISATPEELRELTRHALELFDAKPPDLHNAEEVKQAISDYFASCDLLKKAKRVLSTYRESLAMTGKLNPVTAIFWAKNYDGMTDVQQIEVTAADSASPLQLTQEELQRRIPVYSDAEQETGDN